MNLIFDELPLWGIFIASALLIIFAVELGFRLAAIEDSTNSKKIHTGPIVASSLGLLGFMLAFSFGVVTSRLDERRNLVLEDANAIGTAVLRSELLPEEARLESLRLFGENVRLRIEASKLEDLAEIQKLLSQMDEVQAEIWAIGTKVAKEGPSASLALYLKAINDVIDLRTTRVVVALEHRMPGLYWLILYGLTFLATCMLGYETRVAGGNRSLTIFSTTASIFSVMLVLIVYLDRPLQSKVTQSAMLTLQSDINQALAKEGAK